MHRPAPGARLDLVPARRAVGHHEDVRIGRAHRGQQVRLGHAHGDVGGVGGVAERPGHAAARGFDQGRFGTGDQPQHRDLVRNGASIVVYKMGEDGAITITPEQEFRTGVYPVQALKPTGAGDSFMGGMIAGLAAGHALKDAVLRGSACAAIVVGRVGCAPAMPTTAELDAFVAT